MIALEITTEEVQELRDGLQVVVLLAAIGIPFVVGAFMALLLLLFRR